MIVLFLRLLHIILQLLRLSNIWGLFRVSGHFRSTFFRQGGTESMVFRGGKVIRIFLIFTDW